MAEEQVASQNLVLQNEREKLFSKLQNMQLNNLTAKKQSQVEVKRNRFFKEFKQLSYSFFGLSEERLREFSINELNALDKLITRKAWPWAIYQMLFTFGVPIFGWVIGLMMWADENFHSWHYLCYRKYLKKVYGKEFLPKTLKNQLQPKS